MLFLALVAVASRNQCSSRLTIGTPPRPRRAAIMGWRLLMHSLAVEGNQRRQEVVPHICCLKQGILLVPRRVQVGGHSINTHTVRVARFRQLHILNLSNRGTLSQAKGPRGPRELRS